MNYPEVLVATIVMKDRVNVLIGRDKATGKWVIPSGEIHSFETLQLASARTVLEETSVVIQARQVLFLSEKVKEPEEHKLIVHCEGIYVGGELSPGHNLTEVRWVDPRDLGLYQKEMSDASVDAFYKYSLVLRARAAQGQV